MAVIGPPIARMEGRASQYGRIEEGGEVYIDAVFLGGEVTVGRKSDISPLVFNLALLKT